MCYHYLYILCVCVLSVNCVYLFVICINQKYKKQIKINNTINNTVQQINANNSGSLGLVVDEERETKRY